MIEGKICGITNIEDALFAVDCGADALGFVFHPGSPRYINPERVRGIITRLPEKICTVGVFVNLDPEEVSRIVESCGLDLIQLHGYESPGYCRRFPPERIIKAVSPRTDKDLKTLEAYRARAFLVDAHAPGIYGGTGNTSDWEMARVIARDNPLILSGGLGPDNLADAVAAVNPRAVDMSSRLEASPGKKDHTKLRDTMEVLKPMRAAVPQRAFRIFEPRRI